MVVSIRHLMKQGLKVNVQRGTQEQRPRENIILDSAQHQSAGGHSNKI